MRLVRALLRLVRPVLAGLAVAGLTVLVVWVWPGPFSRQTLSLALAVEVALVLMAVFLGFSWGRRPTFFALYTGQPQAPPEELERRDDRFLWLAIVGATLFVVSLAVG